MSTYRVEVDNGKPYMEECADEGELSKLLLSLKEQRLNDDWPYFDVEVWDNETEVYVTGKVFDELRINDD